MIGLDTNILIRFFVQDDPVQFQQAKKVFQSLSEKKPAWISITNILEVEWVLRSKYDFDRGGLAEILFNLIGLPTVIVEEQETVAHALALYLEKKADFGECMIAASAQAAGCSKVVTFDKIAARDLGMELLPS
jgi:predicted nucleic-acid-binding protein